MVNSIMSISRSNKRIVRQLGLAKLLHAYGGVLVPDSTIMLRNIESHSKKN